MTQKSKDGGCGLVIAVLLIVFAIGQCNSRNQKAAYDRGYQDRAFNDYNPSPPSSFEDY